MKVISICLRGKMAHFRKFYSNSSALSYFIPPRTTICGIVAGLLGWERDKYYEEFSLDNCKIAVASCSPIKKTMQKLNYLMIKSPKKDLNGSQEHHSQTPMELVIPQNLRSGFVDYKVWIYHRNKKIMDNIEGLMNDSSVFYKSKGACMALGSVFNLGWIEPVGIFEAEEVNITSKKLILSSVPIENITEIKIEEIGSNTCKLIKEEVPLEFDKNRCITERGLKEILVNINGGYIPVVVHSFVNLDNEETITWME